MRATRCLSWSGAGRFRGSMCDSCEVVLVLLAVAAPKRTRIALSPPGILMKLQTLVGSLAALGVLGLSHAASAQGLALTINNGLVTLDADNVTVDEILTRWTAATGLTVVFKRGRGSAVPVTIHLAAVSERAALGIVLRDFSGYIMGERRDPRTGAASIDRLIILPDSDSTAGVGVANQLAPVRASRRRNAGAVAGGVLPPGDQATAFGDLSGALEDPPVDPFTGAVSGTVEAPSVPDDAALGALAPGSASPVAMPGTRTPTAAAQNKSPFGSPSTTVRPGQLAAVPPPPTAQLGSASEDPAFATPAPVPGR